MAQLIASIYVAVVYPNPKIKIDAFPFEYPYPVMHYFDLHDLQHQLNIVMYMCVIDHAFCLAISVFLLIPRYQQKMALRNLLQGLGFISSL
jgi:hypothetical protein